MNNYYTLRYLVAELKRKLAGGFFVSAKTYQKNTLELTFELSNEPVCVKVVCAPGNQVIFQDYVRRAKTLNTLDFFGGSAGSLVKDLDMAPADRLIRIHFAGGDALVIPMYSSNANVFHIKDGVIVEAFKSPEKHVGMPEPTPKPPVAMQGVTGRRVEPTGNLHRDLVKINPLLPRAFLPELKEVRETQQYDVELLANLADSLHQALVNRFEPGINPDGQFNPWPGDVYPVSGKEVFESAGKAVRIAWYAREKAARFDRKLRQIGRMLEQAENRLKRRLEQLQDQEKNRKRTDGYEKLGHLLMSSLHLQPDENGSVTVPDYFSGGSVNISLKPGLNMAENAALYYEKARKGRKSAENATAMLQEVKHKWEVANRLLESLHIITAGRNPDQLDQWLAEHSSALETLRLGQEELEGKSFPFRRMSVDGYDIWIGKNAAGNDDLLRASHKEDIWLHARGVSGSHVIVRMNRSAGFPSAGVLEKVASIAAWLSKSRTTALAPVIYAKRKHVRKPKGSAPGLALVDRENVLLVRPGMPEMEN